MSFSIALRFQGSFLNLESFPSIRVCALESEACLGSSISLAALCFNLCFQHMFHTPAPFVAMHFIEFTARRHDKHNKKTLLSITKNILRRHENILAHNFKKV